MTSDQETRVLAMLSALKPERRLANSILPPAA